MKTDDKREGRPILLGEIIARAFMEGKILKSISKDYAKQTNIQQAEGTV